MTKKVSIIIPFKDKTELELINVLASINIQFGIDFSQVDVHLVNDGGAAIDPSKFDILGNLELHYYELPENVGPGMARQYGIDHSDSEYVMFMDSDDQFQYGGALLDFFNVCKYDQEHKMIIMRYIEQFVNNEGEFRYVIHSDRDWKAVYAKWFNRKYLEEIGMRFRPELRIFEDTYFVGLSCQLSDDTYYKDSTVYTWLYNPTSIVRGNNKTFEHQLHTWALQNRFYLEVVREKQPINLRRDLENYVADLYLRYTKFVPSDEAAFWEEHHKILVEFADVWQGYTSDLQAQCDRKKEQDNAKWQGIDTGGFREFVERGESQNR